MTRAMTIFPVVGIGDVNPGDDVAALVATALDDAGTPPREGDVLVVTHKIVSKAEGRVVEVIDDDAYRALVADEAAVVIRRRGDLVITKTSHGFICANAGVDRSNTHAGTAVLLPHDPDRSAHTIRARFRMLTGVDVPVIISDTFGRPWRRGLVDVAVGVSGLEALDDLRGSIDPFGRRLDMTEVATVDELAAAADLVMGKTASTPAALIRGSAAPRGDGRATDLIRPAAEDLFR